MASNLPARGLRHARIPPRHEWWRGKDSNLRRRKPADLQSAPVGRLGTPPQNEPRIVISEGRGVNASLARDLLVPSLREAKPWPLVPDRGAGPPLGRALRGVPGPPAAFPRA